MNKLDFKKRPLSWSAISSFQYSPEQWYKKYILNEKQEENLAMAFGKSFAKSIEDGKPLVPVEVYSKVEYPLKVVFNGIPLIGFIDTFDLEKKKMREYKTARTVWTKKKAQDHGQLKMYALCLYIQHKVKPEDLTIHLDCIQTEENGNFEVNFTQPHKIHSHQVFLTMADILNFGLLINKTVEEMRQYVENYRLQ